ncbi:MAG: SRPBCC family protein [Ilumatobacteraceae bacterium]
MPDQICVERTIRADADRLYQLVTDLPRMGEWSPENTGGRWVKGATGPAVGAHFKGTNRNGWRRWSTDVVVTVAEPGQRFSFDVTAGPFNVATWDFRFDPSDDATRVVQTWTDNRAAVAKKLAPLIAGVPDRTERNRQNMEETLAKLAAEAEV